MSTKHSGHSIASLAKLAARDGHSTAKLHPCGPTLAALLLLGCLGAGTASGQMRSQAKSVNPKGLASAAFLPLGTAEKIGLGQRELWADARYPFPATKLDRGLRLAWQAASEHGKAAARERLVAQNAVLAENGEDVVVVAFPAPGTTIAQLESALASAGATVVRSGPDTVKAAMPIDGLGVAAKLPEIAYVRNLLLPRERNTTTTEGLSATLANAWHAAGLRGSGVKVAVVDNGFTNLVAMKAQDEIPSAATEVNYTASEMTAGSSAHGSACAEIVYDLAPQAQMYLIKVNDPTDLIAVKDYCIAQGIQIVSFSIGWDALNFHDGIACANWFTTAANHPVAAIDQATAAGILWVNAAGNEQMQHVLVDWRDGNADTALDWTSSYAAFNILYLNGSSTIPAGTVLDLYMTWNDWPTTSQDFDLQLYYWTGSAWARVTTGYSGGWYGEDIQDGSTVPYPYEEIVNVVPYTAAYAVVVKSWGTTTTPKFILRCYGITYPTYNVYDSYDLAPGSICIPADAASAFTVGAIDQTTYTTGTIETFSSLGPNNRAFTGGTATTKPDVCGPDFVTTVSYGSEGFGGTSAATPHVAGLAALVKGAYPSYTQSQIKQYIETNGYDLGTAGKDNTYGSGAARLPAPPVVNQAPTNILLSGATVAENLSTGTRVGSFSTQDPDVANTFTYTLAAGTGSGDNGSFTISGSNLLTAIVFNYEVKNNYSIRIQSADQGGLSTQKVFAVGILNANEPPPSFQEVPSSSGSNMVVRWASLTNKKYTVHYSTNLFSGFSVLQSNIPGTPAVNSYTDSLTTVAQKFWKVTTDP